MNDEATPPQEVQGLLAERAQARERRDWETADAIRDRIRQLGWEPIDGAGGSIARPALPAEPAGSISYARPEDVASLLDQTATLDASLVTSVDDHPADLARLAAGMREHPPAIGWELIVVANDVAPDVDIDAQLDGLPANVLPTRTRLGWADAANLGLRRARGRIVAWLDTSLEPIGDFLSPLLAALEPADARTGSGAIGIAGPWGVTSADARQFHEAGPGEVDAVEAYCIAIRREALRAVGGFDRRFRYYRNADLDLSFAIRDAGWRAVSTGELPLRRHEHRGWSSLPDDERDRLSRRNFYRFLKRWGNRPDLLLAASGAADRPAPGA